MEAGASIRSFNRSWHSGRSRNAHRIEATSPFPASCVPTHPKLVNRESRAEAMGARLLKITHPHFRPPSIPATSVPPPAILRPRASGHPSPQNQLQPPSPDPIPLRNRNKGETPIHPETAADYFDPLGFTLIQPPKNRRMHRRRTPNPPRSVRASHDRFASSFVRAAPIHPETAPDYFDSLGFTLIQPPKNRRMHRKRTPNSPRSIRASHDRVASSFIRTAPGRPETALDCFDPLGFTLTQPPKIAA